MQCVRVIRSPNGQGQWAGLADGHGAGDFSPAALLPPSSLWHGLGNFEIWGILKSPCSQTPSVCCPGELGREALCGKNHRLILISALPLWASESPLLCQVGVGLNTASTPCRLNVSSRIPGRGRPRGGHRIGTWGSGWEGRGKDSAMCSWEIWICPRRLCG